MRLGRTRSHALALTALKTSCWNQDESGAGGVTGEVGVLLTVGVAQQALGAGMSNGEVWGAQERIVVVAVSRGKKGLERPGRIDF